MDDSCNPTSSKMTSRGFFIMKNRQRGKFTIIENKVIEDSKLSWKAKGLYAYLQSRPEGWKFYEKEIESRSKDGKDSVKSAIKELVENKYLLRVQSRQEGKFKGMEWILNPEPSDLFIYSEDINDMKYDEIISNQKYGKTDSGKPDIGKTDIGKPDTNNTNSNKTKINNTKELIPKNKFSVDFDSEVEFSFKEVLKHFTETFHPRTPKMIYDWKNCLRMLRDKDGIDLNTVVELVKRVREDDFWQKTFIVC